MDRKELIKWLVGIVARGIAWFLAVKLGMDAAESSEAGTAIAQALGSLALVGISIYTSVKGRKALAERHAVSLAERMPNEKK